MTGWEQATRILDALRGDHPNVMIGIRCDGPSYRAQVVGTYLNGTVIESECRNSPSEAIDRLYDIVLEMVWKEYLPPSKKLERLGLHVVKPTVPAQAGGDGNG